MALAGLAGRRVLIDGATLPGGLAVRLQGARAVGSELSALGAVKTPAEVEAVEASLRLCEAGHAAARAASVAGANELDVWAALRGAIESAAGGRTALLADLVSGPRTQDVGGPPVDRVLAEGDLVICDLVPCHDGIWGDSCAAWAVGEPSAEARRLHAASSAALEATLAALRPARPATRSTPSRAPPWRARPVVPAPHRPRRRLPLPRGAARRAGSPPCSSRA